MSACVDQEYGARDYQERCVGAVCHGQLHNGYCFVHRYLDKSSPLASADTEAVHVAAAHTSIDAHTTLDLVSTAYVFAAALRFSIAAICPTLMSDVVKQ